MLFPEEDAPVLKDWIVKRLENTSDADADILADYILALLNNASDGSNIQSVFEEEITPFLKEDTKTFANDLTLAIKHKSYVPGAAPPPPLSGSDATPAFASSPLNHINNQSPSIPTGPAAAGRKRGFYDRGESDVTSERDPFQAGSPNGRAFKQARRGGGLGRRGYIDPDRPQAVDQINYGGSGGVYPGAAGLNAHAPPYAPTGPANMSGYEPAMNPLEAVRQLQQLQEQINMMAGLAGVGGFYQPPQGYAPHQRSAPQRKRGRCRDYDTKGYCARGPNCLYEHSNGTEGMYGSHNLPAPQMSGQIQLPPEGLLTPGLFQSQNAQDATPALPSFDFLPDFQNFANFGPPSFFHNLFNAADLTQQTEYDPHNATIQPPPMAQQSPKNQRNQRRDNNRQGQGPRKAASRAPFSHSGPMNDKTQTRVVVESIPEENFDEEQVRGFFSQFGSIEEVKMMPYKRLAIVKFDNWDSANAAYRSPKVIFDNRFVKVFWYKDEKHADIGKEHANGSTKNGKRSSSNGFGGPEAYHGDEEEPLDMEEFTRKQEEAQKAHEEKQRVKQEIERKRAELVERQKELQAKQEAEKRRLNDRLGNSRNASAEPGAVTDANGGEENNAGSGSKASAQTEVLRATLARLQEEAKLMGVNPDAQADEDATMSTYASSGYPPRGGRGGYYRGRGGYVPRGSSFRGGRGGGRGNIHAAYAAFSLDNRPRKVALSGVDFSAPEKDEALRQHLFSLGEFAAEIETTPSTTRLTFSDRKAAEKFFQSIRNKTFSGLTEGDEVEPSWVPNTAGPLPGSSSSKVEFSAGGAGPITSAEGGVDTDEGNADADMADAQGSGGPQQENGGAAGGGEALDYDVAGENEWDMA